jgi:serine/threonine protein kinase
MPPEVFLQKPYSFDFDVWSFGVIFYALVSFQLPFSSEELREEII